MVAPAPSPTSTFGVTRRVMVRRSCRQGAASRLGRALARPQAQHRNQSQRLKPCGHQQRRPQCAQTIGLGACAGGIQLGHTPTQQVAQKTRSGHQGTLAH